MFHKYLTLSHLRESQRAACNNLHLKPLSHSGPHAETSILVQEYTLINTNQTGSA